MNPFEQLYDFGAPGGEIALPPEIDCPRLSDVLAAVQAQLGPALLDARGRAAVDRVAQRIPAALSPFWGLEVRLGETRARADLLWEVRQGNGGLPTLAGRNPHDPAPGTTAALRERSPFWRTLARFAGQWLDDPGWLGRLGNIWVEVDTGEGDAALDARLDRPSLFWGWNCAVAGSDRELLAHVAALGRRFYGLELDQARIDAAGDALPAQGVVFQMGVMGGRADPTTRLCVKKLDAEAAHRWLGAIGWPGDRACLRETLDELAPLCGEIALNVDIGPQRAGPKLGLEIYSAQPALSMDRWRPVHERLLEQGLARADKLAALEEFPSYRRFRQIGAWRRTPPLGYPVLITNLHHLKLVFVGDAVIEAKAYLGVYRPVLDYSPTRGHELDGGGGWM